MRLLRPRSLRFRYTLRALLVFVTLFCLWGGYHANRGIKERRVEALIARDSRFALQYGRRLDRPALQLTVLTSYDRLVRRVWGERGVTGIGVPSDIDAETMNALAALPSVESVSISEPGVSIKEFE